VTKRQYKRQYVLDGEQWVQKRAQGKSGNYSLCEGCALNKPDSPEQCKRVIGLGNFCQATKMLVVVWQCPSFIEREEEDELRESMRPIVQQEEVPGA